MGGAGDSSRSSRAVLVRGESPEIVRLVEQMLQKLKPRQRAVLEKTYYEGLTAEEIARRLGKSAHIVRHETRGSM
jgi:RNA polymerase sigma factor (sigma-70 family)